MSTHCRSRLLGALTSTALVLPLAVAGTVAGTSADALAATTTARMIDYTQWDTQAELATGRFAGTRAVKGALRIATPVGTVREGTKTYELGRWTSPWQRPGFAFDELVPSWDASTPRDSFVHVQVRGVNEAGRRSTWYSLGKWAGHDRQFRRTSAGAQTDQIGTVSVDTLKARYSVGFTSWQTRVTLLRRAGTSADPSVDTIGAMTSLLPTTTQVATSRPGVASGSAPLSMPRYSQMIHDGHYPEYDAGGEAWCSPTSVSMVLGRLGRLPTTKQYSWVPAGHPDPWVDHAARAQYDHGWEGAGNWSFSTAYAATRADNAFVTRLRNLREAERFIRAGIPLVASVRFGRGELTGAPISSTNGHLMVIVGFTASGDVVVNDPAAPTGATVRRTYDRGQFENVWVPTSGGLVYVIHGDDQPLPPTRTRNW